MQAILDPITVPEGVEIVGVATEYGKGYRIEGGRLYGSPAHPYSPGAVVVRVADGYESAYNIATDNFDVVKKLAAPKLMTITLLVTNERDLEKLQRGAPRWPGFVSIEEMPSEQPLDATMSTYEASR